MRLKIVEHILSSNNPYWKYPVLSELILARNVVNIPEIESWIDETFMEKAADKPEIQKWLRSNLKNYMVKDYEEFNHSRRTTYGILGVNMKLDYAQTEQLKNFVLSPVNPPWGQVERFMQTTLQCEGGCPGVYAEAFIEFPKVMNGLSEKEIDKIFSFIQKRRIKDTPALRQKLSPEKLEALGYVDRYPTVAAVLW